MSHRSETTSIAGPKVLHVIHSGALGGGPEMVRVLAMADDGVEHIVVSSEDGDLLKSLSHDGVHVVPIPMHRKRHLPLACLKLRRVVRVTAPDAVVPCGQFAGTVVALALLGLKVRNVYVVAWPSYLADKGPIRVLRNWLVERVSASAADAVIFLNQNDAAEFVRRRLVTAAKCCVIPNAIDQTHFHRVSPPDPFKIGFVGRLVREKGIDVLLDALPLLPEPVRRSVVVEIVGDGELEQTLKDHAASLAKAGVLPKLIFTAGRRVDSEWFSRCAVVVIPSREEPFGIVALEAMACETAVIASRVGGLAETIEDGVSGILISPDSPAELADAITSLMTDDKMRTLLGTNARRRIEVHFNVQLHIHRYNSLYTGLSISS